MKTKINNKLIRTFFICYDPSEIGIPDKESLRIKAWIEKYRNKVKKKEDVIWLICRPEFMSDRDCRLFAIWCARESLKLIKTPDQRSINACDVAERFAKGNATDEDLAEAHDNAWSAVRTSGRVTSLYASNYASWSVTWTSALAAANYSSYYYSVVASARPATRSVQIDHLLTYFK